MSLAEPTLVALRESLEAFLIVSIFAGLVVKLGHREARKYLLWGAAAAVGASAFAGAFVDATVRDLFERTGSEPVFAGVTGIVAVAILTYMIVWMYRHTLDLVGGIRERARAALAANRPGLLFAIAFVAVIREGLETILFFASRVAESSAAELLVAALLGIALSATLAWLLFAGILRLSLQKFFAVTGLLLIVFAGGILVTGVHDLTEAHVLPHTATAWSTKAYLDEDSAVGQAAAALLGYHDSPSILEAVAYALYVGSLGAWYALGLARRPRHATPAAHDAAPAPSAA